MANKEEKELKVIMDLLAEKIKARVDLSNLNGLFRKLFSIEYFNLCNDDDEKTSTDKTKVFIKLKKGKEVYHLPIEEFEGDIHDGEYCMSLTCEYSKKIDVINDQKELEKLSYELQKEQSGALDEPNLQ